MRLALLPLYLTLLCVVAKKKKKKKGGPPPKPKDEGPCPGMGFYSKQIERLCENFYPPSENTKDVWVVQFYTQNSREVLEARLPYEGLAMTLGKSDDKLRIGAVDCKLDEKKNVGFCEKQDIWTFPTTRVIIEGRKYDYTGLHNLESLTKFVKTSRERLAEADCSIKGLFDDPRKDYVAPLCTSNFPPNITTTPWIVTFYEEGDAKTDNTLKSSLNKIAEKYFNWPALKERDPNVKEKKVRIFMGAVECGDRKQNCGQFEVTKFPTIRFYKTSTEYTPYSSKSYKWDKLKTWGDDLLREFYRPKHKEEEATGGWQSKEEL